MLQQRSDEKLKMTKKGWPKYMQKKCTAFLAALWVICTLFTGVSASDWDCSGFVGALFGEFPLSQGEQLPAESKVPENLAVFHQILVEGQGPVGLLLERTNADQPSFSLESLERPEECDVTMETVGDMLHITVKAAARQEGVTIVYEEGRRLNVVQVLLPDREYAAFTVKTQEMGLSVQDFSAPMSITTENGPVQLRDSRLTRGSCSLKVDCGPVSIQAESIQKEIAAVVTKGPISVDADTIGGELKLQVTDGPVSIEADTIQKKLDIQVENGPAAVEAGTIGGELALRVTNGPVSIEAAVIEGNVTADAANGPLALRFEQEPANLYLDASGCEMATRLKLPDGWPTVYQAGSGNPKVVLSCKNGPVSVQVEK